MRGPRRTAEGEQARREAASSGAAARVMETGASEAGLAWPPVPWASIGDGIGAAADMSAGEAIRARLSANPFLMAPMAGVTDAAYRLMARAGGAALAYSEMVSVTGIHYKSEKTWELVDPNPAEPELAVQLFGSNVDHFREAVPLVAERLGCRLALIDVNMACPVPKVTKSGAGSALLDDPELAARIVRTVREGLDECGRVEVPVTVKIRIGRRAGEAVGPEFARAMADGGAAAVAVHGRFATQMYRGESNASEVRKVVESVDVPVVASGDALDAPRAAGLLRESGAMGCFVARGTYGNPWVFAGARSIVVGLPASTVTSAMRLEAFRLHVRLLDATGAHIARARSLAGWYLRGVPDAAAWRERAMHCATTYDYLELADVIEARLASGNEG